MLTLTDSVILLRPLQPLDAAAHLAGQDEEIVTRLSSGRSTAATVREYIARSLDEWQNSGPRRALGIFDCLTGSLIGSIEAHLSLLGLKPGQVNVSYSVFAGWRGRGIAVLALRLVCDYLKTSTDAGQVIVRAAPANQASIRVAEKAGFRFIGISAEPDGPLKWYALDLR